MTETANRIKRFWQLPIREKCLFAMAFILVLLIRIGLWILPFRVVQKALPKINFAPFVGEKSDEMMIVQKIVRDVRFASLFVPSATCLTQALAALILLRFSGLEAELKFGIAIDADKKFAAHAWLERGGKIIIGKVSDHRKYTTLKTTNYATL